MCCEPAKHRLVPHRAHHTPQASLKHAKRWGNSQHNQRCTTFDCFPMQEFIAASVRAKVPQASSTAAAEATGGGKMVVMLQVRMLFKCRRISSGSGVLY